MPSAKSGRGRRQRERLQIPRWLNRRNQNGPGGFQVGGTVRVLSDGWQEAKVVQVHGRSYVVHLANMYHIGVPGGVILRGELPYPPHFHRP